jgi:pantetheine-phosphate adenylyltransferase
VTIAIYPGSFDPITKGHLDIAIRASQLFEKLIIAIYDKPAKNVLFTTEERLSLVQQAINHLPNVEAKVFGGLTVDFVKEMGAQAIVRGLRIGADFEREFEMTLMNKKLSPECEVVCLMASLQYQFLSSSLVKEVASLGGNIDDFVPKSVAEALRKKAKKLSMVQNKGGTYGV